MTNNKLLFCVYENNTTGFGFMCEFTNVLLNLVPRYSVILYFLILYRYLFLIFDYIIRIKLLLLLIISMLRALECLAMHYNIIHYLCTIH